MQLERHYDSIDANEKDLSGGVELIKRINGIWDRSISVRLISIFITAFVWSLISDITNINSVNFTNDFNVIEFVKFLIIWIPLYTVVHLLVSIIKLKLTKKI